MEVSKLTVLVMPSMILSSLPSSFYSCSLAFSNINEFSTSSLSISMFVSLLSDSLFVEIYMNSFLVVVLKIL